MSEIFDHILDPDGDMKLTLKNPNTVFAPWPEQYLAIFNGVEKLKNDAQLIILPKNVVHERPLPYATQNVLCPELDDAECHEPNFTVNFRVSSRHLKLASGRSTRLKSEFWTNKVHSDGLIHVILEDWDREALLIVLNIIHSRNRNVPHTVSLEMLAKIAIIIDYFEFHEAVEPFTSVWMVGLSEFWPRTYCRDLVLRIWISSVFGDENGLTKLKAVAVVGGVDRCTDLGLPIPNAILDEIRQDMEDAKAYINLELRQLRAGFESGSLGCSQDCQYGILGAMWINLRMYGMFDEVQTISGDYSIAAIYQTLRDAPPTSVYSKKQRRGRLCCGLGTIVRPLVEETEHRFGHGIEQRVTECSYSTLDQKD